MGRRVGCGRNVSAARGSSRRARGTRWCRCAVVFPLLSVLLGCPALAEDNNPRLRLPVAGQTETVAVPIVIEPWTATAARALPVQNRVVHRLGQFPGFADAKRRANELRRRAEDQSRLPTAFAGALVSKSASTADAATAPGSAAVFDGPSESDTNVIPPDPVLAAGPNNIVVLINSLLAVYDKSGNLQGGGFQPLSTFFGGLGITGQIFDPRIIYDQTDNRFILTAAEVDLTNFTNGHVFVAVSQTSNPTGVWNKYAIDFEGRNLAGTANTFPDFPTLGLSSSAVYISTGQFELNQQCVATDTGGCSFSDTWIKVIGLPELLSGSSPLNITTFQNVKTATGFPAFAIEPALTYGSSSEEFLVAAEFNANPSSTLNVFSINTSGTPALSAADLSVPAFSLPPDARQPGGSLIATNDFRLLNAVWTNGSLWCGQNAGDSNGNAVANWYQISAASLPTVALSQSGTITGAGDAYFPAVSAKPNGEAGVVFTTSSLTLFASSAFVGRDAVDPAGSMTTFAVYKPGTALYDDFDLRWGDYSGASVDPDGNSIWVISEYASSPNPHFGTVVAQIRGPNSANLDLSTTQINFGDHDVGSASAASIVTITNAGPSSAALGSLAVTGADPSDFALVSDNCSSATLSAAASCTVGVTFTPSASGPRTAALSITTNPATFLLHVDLLGNGVPNVGTITAAPDSLSFPDTPLRTASAPQTLTLTNTGVADVTILSLQVPEGYAATNNCGNILMAGKSCTLSITFRPSIAGGGVSQLQVVFPVLNGAAPLVKVSLQANGIEAPFLTPCPTTLSFGNQAVGSTSTAQTVTLSNTGSSGLTITGIALTGDFAQTNSCGTLPMTLPARTACVLNVTFRPSATGTRTGSLVITDNATGSPQTVTVTGTGVSPSGSVFRASPLLAGLPLADHRVIWAFRFVLPDKASEAAARRTYGGLPLSFESNEGQFDDHVQFRSRGAGYTLFLERNEAVLTLRRNNVPEAGSPRLETRASERPVAAILRMKLVGGNPTAQAMGFDRLPGITNYFRGNDPAQWRTRVPNYSRVRYADMYPGIDLVYYGHQRTLEYDFVIAPGADPSAIKLKFEGAEHVRVDKLTGDLVLAAPGGEVRLHKPVVYQPDSGSNRHGSVDGRYALSGKEEITFLLSSYDHRAPLIIDPTLSYSTYLGGSAQDQAYAIAVDSAGNAYITGMTLSADFPVANAIQPSINHTLPYTNDAFVTKLSPDGSSFVYSTFLGGVYSDQGYAIAADSNGNAYVAGVTSSPDFPVTRGAFQTTFKGGGDVPGGVDAFVTAISSDGARLIYSTYLGGSGWDQANGIAVDSGGNAYVAGTSGSTDFPVSTGALQTGFTAGVTAHCTAWPACGNAFVTKLNSTGSALVYSTYLGGTTNESAQGIALDSAGNAYVTGYTASNDFPTTPGAFQTGFSINSENAFISKINPQGTALVYSSYLGGNGGTTPLGDQAFGIAVDKSGSAYITGTHESADFPTTPNAYQGGSQSAPGPAGDAFVARLYPAGCGLIYSTYFGGVPNSTLAGAIALDASGDAYVTGGTVAQELPTVNPIQASCLTCGAPPNFQGAPWIAEFDPTGSKLVYSTYLDGSQSPSRNPNGIDQGRGIAVDSIGNAYVAGQTSVSDFPTLNAVRSSYGGAQDGFVAKLNPTNLPSLVLNPPRLVFPSQAVGTTSASESATLTNQTSGVVSISGITSQTTWFSQTNNCGSSLQAGASCTISVQYTPPYDTNQWGVIVIHDNAYAGPHVLPAYGSGFEPPSVSFWGNGLSQGVVTFGGTPIGTTLGPTQVNLQNGGDAPLTIASIAVTGEFTQTNDCGASVPGHGLCTISVNFTPTAAGTRTGMLAVTDNASGSPQTLPITGIGQDFSLSASPASATITAGQETTYTLTITPAGGFSQAVSLSCSGAPQLANCSMSPPSVTFNSTNAQTVQMIVTTTAPSPSQSGPRSPPDWRSAPQHAPWRLLEVVALLVLVGLVVGVRGRRVPSLAALSFTATVFVILLWASCGGGGGGVGGGGGGGGNPGTPAGTYTLTLTGTYTNPAAGGSNLTHTTTVQLTVK